MTHRRAPAQALGEGAIRQRNMGLKKHIADLHSLRRSGLKMLALAVGALVLGVCLSVILAGELAVRRYRPIADRMALEFGVDAELVLAVFAAESGGRRKVRSHRGAVGLMQVMPATAQELARELGMASVAENDLEDPETNIRLGTYYLSKLDKRFRGDRMLALAAYNAGPTKVAQWQAEHPELSGQVLVDAAAYAETRRFVKAVSMRMAE